jgi:hypothetical protein
MGKANKTYEGTGEILTIFWWKKMKGRSHFEDLSIHMMIILK